MALPSLTGSATADLGMGDMLQSQAAGETEEMRKKRMAEMQAQKMMGAAGSPAAQMLLGGGPVR
jgi:hypothetical protein